MIKCPFCQFENEDGALFCEQCKSDLAAVDTAPAVETIPPVESIPQAMVESVYGSGGPAFADPMPAFADPIAEVTPIAAESVPFAFAEPVAEAPEPAFQMAPEAPAPAPEPVSEPPSAPAATGGFPAGVTPKLVVVRGQKINIEYPVYEGENFIGRSDEKPVDIDLEDQEPPDRIWSSRQHACIIFSDGSMTIEDLNSSNGTFVNRTRVYPGQKRQLVVNDVVQIGTVQMKVKV